MTIDIALIREDLAAVFAALGYNAWSYSPSDAVIFPAMVSGIPTDVRVVSIGGTWSFTLPVALLFDASQPEDAQRRLDDALSPGKTGSVYPALQAAVSPHWKSLKWVGSGPAYEATVGNVSTLAYDLDLEVTAS